MKVTLEISLYPFTPHYEKPIIDFIKGLKQRPALQVFTNAMSTQVSGEWNDIMPAIQLELEKIYEHIDTCSTVIKIVNKPLDIDKGHLNFD